MSQSIPIGRGKDLDNLKRRLLQDRDWAAVSAARPLEIAFSSAQETERFGKRRKLNDADRERLSASNRDGPSGRLPGLSIFHQRNGSYELGIKRDHIKIRIDGEPAGLCSSDSQGMATSPTHPSSESMLLGHEGSASTNYVVTDRNETINTWRLNRISLPPSYNRSSFSFERPRTCASLTPVINDPDPIDPCSPRVSNLGSLIADNQSCHTQVEFNPSASPGASSTNAAGSLMQGRRHFTIDDQELAERLGLGITPESIRWPDYEAVNSSDTPAPSIGADILNHQKSSSWLPQPRRSNLFSSPQQGRLDLNPQRFLC